MVFPLSLILFSLLGQEVNPHPAPLEKPVSCLAVLKSDPTVSQALFFLARAAHRHSLRAEAPKPFPPTVVSSLFLFSLSPPLLLLLTSALVYINLQGSKSFIWLPTEAAFTLPDPKCLTDKAACASSGSFSQTFQEELHVSPAILRL